MSDEVASPDAGTISFRAHRDVFVMCAAMLLLAVVLRVDGQGGVRLPYGAGPPLPGICLTRNVLHTDCPGCGMTRSFVAMADGQVARAYSLHRVGPILFIYVLLQVPLRAYALITGKQGPLAVLSRYSAPTIWAFIIALLVNWGYNVLTGAALH